MIRKGYYKTKGDHIARFDSDVIRPIGTGVVREFGFVAYQLNGEFAYKDEHPEIGDRFDIRLETWTEERQA